jgi:hypothetical protein
MMKHENLEAVRTMFADKKETPPDLFSRGFLVA